MKRYKLKSWVNKLAYRNLTKGIPYEKDHRFIADFESITIGQAVTRHPEDFEEVDIHNTQVDYVCPHSKESFFVGDKYVYLNLEYKTITGDDDCIWESSIGARPMPEKYAYFHLASTASKSELKNTIRDELMSPEDWIKTQEALYTVAEKMKGYAEYYHKFMINDKKGNY